MRIFRFIKKAIKAAIPPFFFLILTAYFGWNTMNGDHGLRSYYAQTRLLDRAKSAKDDAISEQQTWAKRVQGLKDNALDADLLDERTRAMSNLARSNEIIIPYASNDHLY